MVVEKMKNLIKDIIHISTGWRIPLMIVVMVFTTIFLFLKMIDMIATVIIISFLSVIIGSDIR
jgi:hypothetical protein